MSQITTEDKILSWKHILKKRKCLCVHAGNEYITLRKRAMLHSAESLEPFLFLCETYLSTPYEMLEIKAVHTAQALSTEQCHPLNLIYFFTIQVECYSDWTLLWVNRNISVPWRPALYIIRGLV